MSLPGDARVQRMAGLRAREIGGETVLVVPGSLEVRVLNEVARRVWELADDATVDEITTVLVEEYSADRSLIERDVRTFLESLASDGMLRVATGPRGAPSEGA